MLTVVAPILRCEWDLSSFPYAVLLMSTLFSMTVSGGLTATFGDRFGRKPIAVISAIGITASGVLCAFAKKYWEFLALRIVIGFFLGMGTGPVIALSGEVAPKAFRATALSVLPLPWGLGVSIGAGIAYLVIEPYGWQGLLLAISLVFSPCIIFFSLVRESPRYDYHYRGDVKSAEKTIKRIIELNRRDIPEFKLVESELQKGDQEVIGCGMVWRTLKRTENVKNGLIILTLTFFAVFNYYLYAYITPRILNEGYCSSQKVTVQESCTYDKSVLFNLAVVSLAGPLGDIISLILQHFLGRRKVFIGSAIITAIIPFSLYYCFSHTYLLVCLVLLRANLDATCLAHNILMSEYMPTVIRSFMTSMVGVSARWGGVIASFSSEYIYQTNSRLGIAIIQGCAVACIVCLVLLKRETMGASLG